MSLNKSDSRANDEEKQFERPSPAEETPEEQTIPTEKTEKREEAKAVTVCISSRSLLDLESEYKIYVKQGLKEYLKAVILRENEPFGKGTAFPLVEALLAVNKRLLELDPEEERLFDVVLMSNNSALAGVAVIKTIKHYKLPIEKMCFTAGRSGTGYLEAFGTHLFLSADKSGVVKAFNKGIASAYVCAGNYAPSQVKELRVVFDGEAVFTPETCTTPLVRNDPSFGFMNVDSPLGEGSLKKFASILGEMKKKFPADDCPIRTYLVTKSGGSKTGERVFLTLRSWGLDIDEAFFLAEKPKGQTVKKFLEKIQPHLYLGKPENIESVQQH